MPEIVKTVGRYELLSEIGRGGLAVVYRARQPALDRIVAIKEATFYGVDRDSVQRFLREACVAGSLSHSNIATVYDYLEYQGTPYIVMEYLERGSLRPYVGQLTLSQIGGMLEGVLAALAHADSHGLAHRDLKPENLLVADDGGIKITDFGLAQVAARTIDGSDTTLVAGTPAYMAPEQAMGQSVGIWSDLYSVGCIAFEQFTGHVPFDRSLRPMEILMRQVNEPIPPVRSVNPEVDRDVSDWIERLLIKDPAQRPRSPTDVWRAFDDILIEARGPRWRREASLPFASAGGGGAVALPSAGPLETDEGEFVTYEPEFEPPREPEPEPAADRDFHTGEMLPAPSPALDAPSPASFPVAAPEPPAARQPSDTAPAPDVSSPVEPAITRRTPHIDLSLEPPLRPGTVFEVTVYADEIAARAGEDTEDLVLQAPQELTSFELDIWLVATHHFLITDAAIKAITLRRDASRSEVATFRVAVVAAPGEREQPVISASFSCNGRPSGRVTRVVPIAEARTGAASYATAATPTLEVDVEAVAPDLVMEISAPENDGRRFEVRVETPLIQLDRRTESWMLPAEAPALVDAAMQQFFAPDASRAARLSSLEGAGLEFFDTAPALLKDTYWHLVDAGHKPRTMLIVSDERSIPWELVVPHRRLPDGEREVRRALGTELAIGRWHRQSGISPRQQVPLRTSYVVAPQYRRSAALTHAAEEAQFVCSRLSGRRIDPASFDHLDLTLGEEGADLLHFICHGESDESGLQLLLLDEPDVLNSRQVRAMPGLGKACREDRPMVFLNACDVGRPTRGLIGTAGFAKSFIDIDASCVVGALWSVDDRVAHAVAVEFYEQVLSEPPVPFAEALRRLRARGYTADGNDSYAAYCFYGDPTAHST